MKIRNDYDSNFIFRSNSYLLSFVGLDFQERTKSFAR